MNDNIPIYDEAIAAIKAAEKKKQGIILYIDEGTSAHVIMDGVTSLDLAELIIHLKIDYPEAFSIAQTHELQRVPAND
jgi:hypothetical protein